MQAAAVWVGSGSVELSSGLSQGPRSSPQCRDRLCSVGRWGPLSGNGESNPRGVEREREREDGRFSWHGGRGGGGRGGRSSSPEIDGARVDCAGTPLTQAGARQSITLLIRHISAQGPFFSLPCCSCRCCWGPRLTRGFAWAGLGWPGVGGAMEAKARRQGG